MADFPQVPDLVVGRLLGEGATSRAYLARDVALDIPITLKVLRSEVARSPEGRARFEREARAAANIVHPNVASAHRFGVLPDGAPYLVTRYVHGRTLEAMLAAEGPLDTATTRRILADVASALDAAHRQGVVHRDIRPANILLDENDGRAIITDFGTAAFTEAWSHGRDAKLTKTGQLLGDPHYVSPEQFRGEAVTEATDIYSLALVGFEMLTGKKPNADLGARAAAVARMTGEPIEFPSAIDDADPALTDLLRRCLAADAAHRPGAQSVARRLRGEPSMEVAPPLLPESVRRAWRQLSRRRLPQWVAAVTATGWLGLSAVDQLVERGMLTDLFYPLTLANAVAAVLAAAVLAWFHGERGEQRFRVVEVLLLALLGAAWLATLTALLR